MLPHSFHFVDLTLLLLRLMVAFVFMMSGWNHLKDSDARSKSIEMSKGFTILLGLAETLGGLGLVFGVLTQLAALGLTLLMLGAITEEDFRLACRFLG